MGHAFLECPAEIPFEMIFDLRTSLPSQEIGNSTMWYDWHIHITFIRPGVFAKMYHLCASVGLCGKQQALTPVDIFETPNLFVCFLMQFMQLWPNPTKPAILSFALLCSALLVELVCQFCQLCQGTELPGLSFSLHSSGMVRFIRFRRS